MPKGNPKIKGQDYEDLIRRMIAAGWSSLSIALYIRTRFGVELHDSTVRVYRLKHEDKIKEEYPKLAFSQTQEVFKERALKADVQIDVLGKLAEMIRLQEARIVIDVIHEEQMSKLFGSTRHEIETLGRLLQEYHAVMQDWGVVPHSGVKVEIDMAPDEHVTPLMLVDVIDEAEVERVIDFAEFVAEKTQLESGNGQG